MSTDSNESDTGIMSAKRLAEIRARANAATPGPWSRNYQGKFMAPDPLWPGEPDMVTGVITASTYPGQEGMIFASDEDAAFVVAARTDVPALLAHLDALTPPPGTMDAEALGRATRRARHDAQGIGDAAERAMPWDDMDAGDRETYSYMGKTLHAIGYAAGRSEGEAERAQLEAQIANNDAVARESIEAAHEEIARLTAELAEAKRAINAAIESSHDAAIAQEQAVEPPAGREACRSEVERLETDERARAARNIAIDDQ